MKEFVYRTSVAACRYYRLIFFIRMSNVRLLASSGLPVGYYVSHFFFHLVERERENGAAWWVVFMGKHSHPDGIFTPFFLHHLCKMKERKRKDSKRIERVIFIRVRALYSALVLFATTFIFQVISIQRIFFFTFEAFLFFGLWVSL